VAADLGDIETAQLLLSRGADVNACAESTPLCAAVLSGHEDMVRFLLRNGALVDLETMAGDTPLTCAAIENSTNMVKILLDLGANIHGSPKVSALCNASRHLDFKVALLLLDNGANANPVVQSIDLSPIYNAIANRNGPLARILLEKGADVNAQDLGIGFTALHQAAMMGFEFMIPCLLELGARTDILDKKGRTPLKVASEWWNFGVVMLLQVAVL
jgi:ankyrin repeat protein